MNIELKQAAEQAIEAFDAFGEDDDFASLFALNQKMDALRTAIQQPAATEPAELTNEQIFDVLKQIDPEAKRLPPGISKIARAIFALRPTQVPMTDDDVDAKCLAIIGHLLSRRERDRIVWRMAEAHHGIKPKEQA